MKRHFIIDTDTASDDAWAIIEALRATEIASVHAITTVSGNFSVELCTKNALIAVEYANTYSPPIYVGSDTPLASSNHYYAEFCHGSDGLGGMNLPEASIKAETIPAVDALISLSKEYNGEIEILTIGPLTNIAKAILTDAQFAKRIRHLWVLGGAVNSPGNMTEYAEYNVYCDPEAAQIVLNSGANQTWVVWNACQNGGEISSDKVDKLSKSNDNSAVFCAHCCKKLREYYLKQSGKDSFLVVDTALISVALLPRIITKSYEGYISICTDHSEKRGQTILDLSGHRNCLVCERIDTAKYKQLLFSLLTKNDQLSES